MTKGGITFKYQDKLYDTGHGTIRILFDASLIDTGVELIYKARSNRIRANGYADKTKQVHIKMGFAYSEKTVTITKTAKIEKPLIHPGFDEAVRDGLEREMNKLIHDLL
jgi:hypothetical protein